MTDTPQDFWDYDYGQWDQDDQQADQDDQDDQDAVHPWQCDHCAGPPARAVLVATIRAWDREGPDAAAEAFMRGLSDVEHVPVEF